MQLHIFYMCTYLLTDFVDDGVSERKWLSCVFLSRPSSLLFQMTTPIIHEALSEQQLRLGFTVGKDRVRRRGLGPRIEKDLMMMMILTVL